MMPVMLVLLLYTLALSLYDLRTGKVPNWATLPLLIAGFLTHFPGTLPVWIASLFVFTAWYYRQMGAGDAKLWMALFWTVPSEQSANIPFILFASLLGTALLQILFRALTHRPLSGQRSPAAWRTIPFILWSLFAY
jgi:Flp pilus assembly protein protease CpaA